MSNIQISEKSFYDLYENCYFLIFGNEKDINLVELGEALKEMDLKVTRLNVRKCFQVYKQAESENKEQAFLEYQQAQIDAEERRGQMERGIKQAIINQWGEDKYYDKLEIYKMIREEIYTTKD